MTQPTTDPKPGDNARRVMYGAEAIEACMRAAHAPDAIEPTVGAIMPDGSIYAGISNHQDNTEKALYATPTDAPLTRTFNEAADYAYKLRREKYLGHDDWRLPTQNELNVLFKNHAAIGGFNVSGSTTPASVVDPAGWYWSEAPVYAWSAWCQRFGIGPDHYNGRSHRASVRCVRLGEPMPCE